LAKEIRLPQLGQTMEEGTIVSCKVQTGDQISKGSVIFEIETDKATFEMESPLDGFVSVLLVSEGQTLKVGEPMLIVGRKDEQISQKFINSLKGSLSSANEQITLSSEKPAEDLNFEIPVFLSDSDPVSADTLPSVSEPKLGQAIRLSRLQKITGRKMLQSKREIPCFYLTVCVDVTGLVELRTKLNETAEAKISYNDFIIRAVGVGLEKYPLMTGQFTGESIKLADEINIGLAISVPDGLVAPLVKNADKNDIHRIAAQTKMLVEKARNNKLAPADLEGGCCTISNLGALGIENFIPIVVPGQCSIFGIGQITDTVIPGNGGLFIRKMMNMTLSVDHKVVNGAYAAQFLDFVRKILEDSSKLV
jgi:pyruvate dehydrogenase E2 component (dihydrolipoamide acetyltransferase)